MFAQFVFYKREELENKSVEKFITELKTLVKPCAYTNPDKMVKDHIVIGIGDTQIRKHLLIEGDSHTLQIAKQKCYLYKITQTQLQSFGGKELLVKKIAEIAAIQKYKQYQPYKQEERHITERKPRECFFC